MIDQTVAERFHRLSLIGQGTCGRVFLARDTHEDSLVALKIGTDEGRLLLENERGILITLQGCSGVPKLIAYGECGDYSYMAIQLLGQSLEDKFIECFRKFEFEDFVNYTTQLISIIDNIHSYGVIHRDLKPRQILFGPTSSKDQLYVIDFGISMRYVEKTHIPYKEDCSFAGTFNYCSVNMHKGIQQSRRDDLETFCYVMAYFYLGSLPWIKAHASDPEVCSMKCNVTGKELFGTASKDLVDIFKYTKQLKFSEDPDYEYIKQKLRLHSDKFTLESRVYRQYNIMPLSKPKKIKKKFTFIEDTEEILLNFDSTIVSKGPEINREILKKF